MFTVSWNFLLVLIQLVHYIVQNDAQSTTQNALPQANSATMMTTIVMSTSTISATTGTPASASTTPVSVTTTATSTSTISATTGTPASTSTTPVPVTTTATSTSTIFATTGTPASTSTTPVSVTTAATSTSTISATTGTPASTSTTPVSVTTTASSTSTISATTGTLASTSTTPIRITTTQLSSSSPHSPISTTTGPVSITTTTFPISSSTLANTSMTTIFLTGLESTTIASSTTTDPVPTTTTTLPLSSSTLANTSMTTIFLTGLESTTIASSTTTDPVPTTTTTLPLSSSTADLTTPVLSTTTMTPMLLRDIPETSTVAIDSTVTDFVDSAEANEVQTNPTPDFIDESSTTLSTSTKIYPFTEEYTTQDLFDHTEDDYEPEDWLSADPREPMSLDAQQMMIDAQLGRNRTSSMFPNLPTSYGNTASYSVVVRQNGVVVEGKYTLNGVSPTAYSSVTCILYDDNNRIISSTLTQVKPGICSVQDDRVTRVTRLVMNVEGIFYPPTGGYISVYGTYLPPEDSFSDIGDMIGSDDGEVCTNMLVNAINMPEDQMRVDPLTGTLQWNVVPRSFESESMARIKQVFVQSTTPLLAMITVTPYVANMNGEPVRWRSISGLTNTPIVGFPSDYQYDVLFLIVTVQRRYTGDVIDPNRISIKIDYCLAVKDGNSLSNMNNIVQSMPLTYRSSSAMRQNRPIYTVPGSSYRSSYTDQWYNNQPFQRSMLQNPGLLNVDQLSTSRRSSMCTQPNSATLNSNSFGVTMISHNTWQISISQVFGSIGYLQSIIVNSRDMSLSGFVYLTIFNSNQMNGRYSTPMDPTGSTYFSNLPTTVASLINLEFPTSNQFNTYVITLVFCRAEFMGSSMSNMNSRGHQATSNQFYQSDPVYSNFNHQPQNNIYRSPESDRTRWNTQANRYNMQSQTINNDIGRQSASSWNTNPSINIRVNTPNHQPQYGAHIPLGPSTLQVSPLQQTSANGGFQQGTNVQRIPLNAVVQQPATWQQVPHQGLTQQARPWQQSEQRGLLPQISQIWQALQSNRYNLSGKPLNSSQQNSGSSPKPESTNNQFQYIQQQGTMPTSSSFDGNKVNTSNTMIDLDEEEIFCSLRKIRLSSSLIISSRANGSWLSWILRVPKKSGFFSLIHSVVVRKTSLSNLTVVYLDENGNLLTNSRGVALRFTANPRHRTLLDLSKEVSPYMVEILMNQTSLFESKSQIELEIVVCYEHTLPTQMTALPAGNILSNLLKSTTRNPRTLLTNLNNRRTTIKSRTPSMTHDSNTNSNVRTTLSFASTTTPDKSNTNSIPSDGLGNPNNANEINPTLSPNTDNRPTTVNDSCVCTCPSSNSADPLLQTEAKQANMKQVVWNQK